MMIPSKLCCVVVLLFFKYYESCDQRRMKMNEKGLTRKEQAKREFSMINQTSSK